MMRRGTKLGLSWLFVVGLSCGREATIGDAAPDAPPSPGTVCDNDKLASGGCTTGACRLYSSSRPLALGTSVGLTELTVTADLVGDALGSSLCKVDWPSADAPRDLNLAIGFPHAPDDALLFEHRGVGNDTGLDVTGPGDGAVVGLLRGSGTFGIAKKPAPWSIERSVGIEALASDDGPSWLRNVTHEFTNSAFFDGAHLFVANGPRILVYDGIPADPLARPKLVLGQPDLDSLVGVTSGALFGTANVVALWSDETRLVAATGNRVLVWQSIPTESMTPADLVLGQPDMSSNRPNAGGAASASTMLSAAAVSSDGTRLWVADAFNHRVLGWSTFPTASSTPADLVLGQPDFVSTAPFSGNLPMYIPEGALATDGGVYVSGVGGPGLSFVANPSVNASAATDIFKWQFLPLVGGLSRPAGIARLAGGGIAVRDFGFLRIACTRGSAGAAAPVDFFLGQPDAERVVPVRFADSQNVNPARVDASNISLSIGLSSTASGAVLVPDEHRLLVFDTPPSYHYEPASRVVGQAGFSVNEHADYRAVSGATLAAPAAVSVKNGVIAVADRSNNRVLLWRSEDMGSIVQAASVIVGQPDARSFIANGDIVSASAKTLSGPEGVALDGAHLVVADTQNHRVLVWNSVPKTIGTPADIVLGQADFSGRRPNHGRLDVAPLDGFSDAAADGFFYPTDVASDGTHLFVADRSNHRVLAWDSFPTHSGQPADRVLGQPSMTSVRANFGGGAFAVSPSGMNLPSGLSLDGTTLWVADTENSRVVRWENATTAAAPTAWLGQADGTTIASSPYERSGVLAGTDPQTPVLTTASTVLRPRKVIAANGKVFVSELDSNRVHVFDGASFESLGALGQPNLTTASPNSTGIGAASLAEPMGLATDGTNLWVADARNHRVLAYPLANVATGAPATKVLGQANMLGVGFNRSSVAAAGVTAQPRAIAVSGDLAFVADTGNSRVLQQRIAGDAWALERVFGQPDDALALPNAGGPTTASSLNRPRGVWSDANRLVVADTDNHRVLVFDRNAADAAARVVLGQSSFTGAGANANGPSAASMNLPSGVCSDGALFAVADTGNSRVLVWKTLPSTTEAASIVLGQATPTEIAPNRGSSAASASTMAYPSACAIRGDSLYVADTGNNRVLRFSLGALANGAPAAAVLGQPDGVSRVPAPTVLDADHLAGPAGLSFDAANLYVAERDLGRVVVFGTDGKVVTFIGGNGSPSLLRAGDGVAAVPTGSFTTRLYVSETGSDHVSIVGSVSRLQLR